MSTLNKIWTKLIFNEALSRNNKKASITINRKIKINKYDLYIPIKTSMLIISYIYNYLIYPW
jgi:hypothetical protein